MCKGKRTRNAGVNTLKRPFVRLLPEQWLVVSYLHRNQPAHSGPAIASSTKLFVSVPCLMCCVCSHARMASSTCLCLGFAVPIIFHESPMFAFILCWASYYPLPVSAFIGIAACHPFSLLIHRVVYSLRYRLNMGASLALITFVLRLTGRNNWLFLAFHNGTVTYALSTHNFFFLF